MRVWRARHGERAGRPAALTRVRVLSPRRLAEKSGPAARASRASVEARLDCESAPAGLALRSGWRRIARAAGGNGPASRIRDHAEARKGHQIAGACLAVTV